MRCFGNPVTRSYGCWVRQDWGSAPLAFLHSSGVWGESCGNPSRKRSPAQPSLKLAWMAGGSSGSGGSPERLSRRNTLVSLPLLHHNTLNLIGGRAHTHTHADTLSFARVANLLVKICDCPRYSLDFLAMIHWVWLISGCQEHLRVIRKLVVLRGWHPESQLKDYL